LFEDGESDSRGGRTFVERVSKSLQCEKYNRRLVIALSLVYAQHWFVFFVLNIWGVNDLCAYIAP